MPVASVVPLLSKSQVRVPPAGVLSALKLTVEPAHAVFGAFVIVNVG